MIKLEDGKTYVDGHGRHVKIAGPTRRHPEYVYSVGGNWYERATGKFVHSDWNRPHYTLEKATFRDIVSEAPHEPE